MKKLAKPRKTRQLLRDCRGATMVEYSLMLFLILVVASLTVKSLGSKVNVAIGSAIAAF
jgi:Flp pilus assembly pilin Flp